MFKNFINKLSSNTKNGPKICVIGAGVGGTRVASSLYSNTENITIIDGSEYIHNNSLNSYVAFGDVKPEQARRLTSQYVPQHLNLVSEFVEYVVPEQNKVVLQSGHSFNYDALVIASGSMSNYDSVEGLQAALEDSESFVGSSSDLKYAVKYRDIYDEYFRPEKWLEQIFKPAYKYSHSPIPKKRGDLVFAQNTAETQSLMHMIAAELQKNGGFERYSAELNNYNSNSSQFSVPFYNELLTKLAEDRGVILHTNWTLSKVDKDHNMATFIDAKGNVKEQYYNLLHAEIPLVAPSYIKKSNLSDNTGYLAVNVNTLQHSRYANIFGLGDSCKLPVGHTGASAGVYAQQQVLEKNIRSFLEGKELNAEYHGQCTVPVAVGDSRLLLAEYQYGNVRNENRHSDILDNVNQIYYSTMTRGFLPEYVHKVSQLNDQKLLKKTNTDSNENNIQIAI